MNKLFTEAELRKMADDIFGVPLTREQIYDTLLYVQVNALGYWSARSLGLPHEPQAITEDSV